MCDNTDGGKKQSERQSKREEEKKKRRRVEKVETDEWAKRHKINIEGKAGRKRLVIDRDMKGGVKIEKDDSEIDTGRIDG